MPIEDPRWRETVFEHGTDADWKNGPAARSFAADAHDRIMVRIKRSYRIQVCGTKIRPQWRAPLGSSTHRQAPSDAKLPNPLSQFIIAPRAQASRRCETQATLGGKAAKLCYRFGPLTPSARSANLIAGDGMKNGFPAPNKELAKTKNNHLTGKTPYKFESISLQRRVCKPSVPRKIRVVGCRRPPISVPFGVGP